jgi:hypothetical protein
MVINQMINEPLVTVCLKREANYRLNKGDCGRVLCRDFCIREDVPLGLTPKHTQLVVGKGARTVSAEPTDGVVRSQPERYKGRQAPMMNDGSRVFLSRPLRIVGAK